jgi:hypothetical protein
MDLHLFGAKFALKRCKIQVKTMGLNRGGLQKLLKSVFLGLKKAHRQGKMQALRFGTIAACDFKFVRLKYRRT